MRVTSNILVQDPVDADDLSAAASEAAGLPAPSRGWHLFDFGALNILRAEGDPAGVAEVSVQFAPGGERLLDQDEDDPLRPEGYALVSFTAAGGGGPGEDRPHRGQLIESLGLWLTRRGLDWSWQHDDGPWMAGHPGAASARPDAVSGGHLRQG